ncbi:GT2D2 protein, partial [Atractosteus spatula]|nr:GT2D2 protein [Atractosteus spatula]
MSRLKMGKVDSECRVFNKEWTEKFFFTDVGTKAICLIGKVSLAVFKEYNLSHHFSTKHANYASNLSCEDKLLSEGELLKECMIETSDILCPESKNKFEKISLSCKTVTRRVEVIVEYLACELNKKLENFKFYSIALDESTDIKDTYVSEYKVTIESARSTYFSHIIEKSPCPIVLNIINESLSTDTVPTVLTTAAITPMPKKPNIALNNINNFRPISNLLSCIVMGTCTCKQMTTWWSMVVFYNFLDISAYNTFVVWTEVNPAWNQGTSYKKRLFLEELGRALVTPLIQRCQHLPHTLPLPVW